MSLDRDTYRALLDAVPDGMLLTDAETNILAANVAAARLLGFDNPDAMVGTPAIAMLEGDERDDALEAVETLSGSDESATRIYTPRRPDGSTVPMEVTSAITRLPDGTAGLVAIFRDVGARLATERALRASERRYRALFEGAPISLWEEDISEVKAALDALAADGVSDIAAHLDAHPELVAELAGLLKVTHVNPATLRMLNARSREQLLGNLDVVFADALPALRAHMVAIAEGQPTFQTETAHRTVDGRRRKVLVSSVLPARSDFRRIIVAVIDITEQRRVEANLAQADRLASVGLLAAGVAHEINNPLTYVLHNLQSVAADLEAGDPTRMPREWRDDLLERSREALEGARRVHGIVRDLHVFSRTDEDQQGPVQVNDVLESAISMAHNEIRYRARLDKDLGDLPPVLGNAGRLSQAFLNLLLNASHAIEEGEVEQNEIRVRSWHERDHVCVEIGDTGRGVPPEHLARLFEPFFGSTEGTSCPGLGLSICYSIVRDHGGTIEVASTVERGTTFVVKLPRARQSAVHQPVAASQPTAPAAALVPRGRVLIVDDEQGIRRALRRLLRADHEVVTAESGSAAQALLDADQDFDVVVCDLMMPDISGMELHGWIAQRQPQLRPRMLFMTGGVFTPRAQQFIDSVPNVCLEKPFDPAHMRTVIGDMIRTARRGRQRA